MQKKNIRSLFALVLALSLVLSVLSLGSCSFADDIGSEPILTDSAVEITLALNSAFAAEALVMKAEADAYEASGEILKDANGADIDMQAYIADLRAEAELLPTLTYRAYVLAIMDDIYKRDYIGEYKSVATLSAEIASLLRKSFYLDRLTDEETTTEALIYCYTAAVGDRYSSFVNQETASDLANQGENYVGIGITVTKLESGYMEVLSVTKDSPAESAGFLVGDIIVAVNGEDVLALGYDGAVARVRGEVGTTVTLTVERDGTRLELTATRAQLKNLTVSYKMLESGEGRIGYIRITQFEETTFTQFVEAVEALEAAGAVEFVFDVRNNSGGRLETVLGILEYITPDDRDLPLIRMQYKNSTVEYRSVDSYLTTAHADAETVLRYLPAQNHAINARMTVLCNEYTASAGELFTSCLKDFGIAEIFGTVTYGKGTGQTGFYVTDYYAYRDAGHPAYTIREDAYFRVSTFYYAPPVSDNYENAGVIPHHTVTLSEEAAKMSIERLGETEDTQLMAAIAFLKSGAPLSPAPSPNQGDSTPPDGDQQTDSTGGAFDIVLYVLAAVVAITATVLTVYFVIDRRRKKSDSFLGTCDHNSDTPKDDN